MLIEFSVGNYRSFQEVVTLNMQAAKITARNKSVDEQNLFRVNKQLQLLKSAAIYGANASGKSNLAAALVFMKRFVHGSSKDSQIMDPIDVEPFLLSEETTDQPSFFEIVFIVEGTQYRYGFRVTVQRVVEEWLYHVPLHREAMLFHRDEGEFHVSGVFKEGRDIGDKTRDNALFLSVVAQFNGDISKKILMWFSNLNIISGIEDRQYLGFTLRCLTEGTHREKIIKLIKELDLSISDVQVEVTPVSPDILPNDMPESLKKELLRLKAEQRKVTTFHQKYSRDGQPVSLAAFDFDHHESEGTKKALALAGPLIDTLTRGRILVVDEFDARMHPMMSREIVKLFASPDANPQNAQLVFMTHDTNLLDKDIFRRDQIWFTEKNRRGASTLYSLAEYRVRNDASFEKDYILGKYGATPFIGDLESVFGEIDGE